MPLVDALSITDLSCLGARLASSPPLDLTSPERTLGMQESRRASSGGLALAQPGLCSTIMTRGMPGRLVLDSGLDAFSQYPSHGSLATPVIRLIAETRGAARGFLSYYHVLPSPHPLGYSGERTALTDCAEVCGRRVKPTCLTTV